MPKMHVQFYLYDSALSDWCKYIMAASFCSGTSWSKPTCNSAGPQVVNCMTLSFCIVPAGVYRRRRGPGPSDSPRSACWSSGDPWHQAGTTTKESD